MKRNWIALLLAAVLIFGTSAFAAVAVEDAEPAATDAPAADTAADKPAAEVSAQEYVPGTLAFSQIRDAVLAHNYTALALGENIAMLDEIDYKKLEDQMRDGLNEIASAQWQLKTAGSSPAMDALMSGVNAIATTPDPSAPEYPTADQTMAGAIIALNTGMKMLQSGFAQSQDAALQAQYDALDERFNDLRDGKLQADNEGIKHQLKTTQEQLVAGAETLYITLLGLERSDAALTRSLQSLDRTVTEMELRHQLGQISALQLQQVTSGRAQLVSGQQTLQMNMELMRMQLNAFVGVDPGARLTLLPLEPVDAAQLSSLDVVQDLLRAQSVSYEVYALKKAKDEAKEVYDDAVEKYGANSQKPEFLQEKHSWQAAQYTYSAGIQSFAIKFRTQFAKLNDAAQVLQSKQSELSLKQSEYTAAQMKYQQGAISANALKTAEDAVAEARDGIADAEQELFANYISYRRAVNSGILN